MARCVTTLDLRFSRFEARTAHGLRKCLNPIGVWTLAKVRQDHRCVMCGLEVWQGFYCYRPITEHGGVRRWMRACLECVDNATDGVVKGTDRHL